LVVVVGLLGAMVLRLVVEEEVAPLVMAVQLLVIVVAKEEILPLVV
jgi:hypothetical protein